MAPALSLRCVAGLGRGFTALPAPGRAATATLATALRRAGPQRAWPAPLPRCGRR